MADCDRRVRRRRRTAVPDAGACQNFRCVRLAAVESRRTGDDGDRLGRLSRERRSETPAWRGFDPGGGGRAVLAKTGNTNRRRRLADRRGVSRVGHRQQPDAETFVGRPGGHRPDQRRRGWSHEFCFWRCLSAHVCHPSARQGRRSSSGSSASASVSCFLSWRCAISAPPGLEPISRSRRSSARQSRSSCSTSQ